VVQTERGARAFAAGETALDPFRMGGDDPERRSLRFQVVNRDRAEIVGAGPLDETRTDQHGARRRPDQRARLVDQRLAARECDACAAVEGRREGPRRLLLHGQGAHRRRVRRDRHRADRSIEPFGPRHRHAADADREREAEDGERGVPARRSSRRHRAVSKRTSSRDSERSRTGANGVARRVGKGNTVDHLTGGGSSGRPEYDAPRSAAVAVTYWCDVRRRLGVAMHRVFDGFDRLAGAT